MMSDDRWFEDLVRLAKEERDEQERQDPRWGELTEGDLPPEEVKALRALAEDSEEAGRAWQAYSPLGEDFERRVAEAARFQLRGRAEDPQREPAREVEMPNPAPARHRNWARWTPALIAAALTFFVLWPGGNEAPLPEYGLRLEGTATVQRTAPERVESADDVIEVAAGNRLRILLTPETADAGPLEARVVLEGGDDLPSVRLTIAPTGAVRLEGVAGVDVPFIEGRAHLLMTVGREGELPTTDDLAQALATTDETEGEAWRAWRLRLKLIED